MANGSQTAPPERSRLVDHFKRGYQIIVGLSITLACGKLFCSGTPVIDSKLWMFLTFFVTIVPIFQGGDRSLDIKYLQTELKGFWQKAAYVWDVYMLLLTAILFVKVAQAIPQVQGCPASFIFGSADSGAGSTAGHFYLWMTIMLSFDALVLLVDWTKTKLLGLPSREKVKPYWWWIAINLVVAVICGVASAYDGALPWIGTYTALFIFVLAVARSVADYCLGHEFMFP